MKEMNEEEKLSTGTTTVGMVYKDGVILAADKRATAGKFVANRDIKKVLKVNDDLALTTAGSVSDIQLLSKHLKSKLNLSSIRTGRNPTIKEAANLLSRWVYSIIRSTHGVTHFIVGGYDDKPRLFDIYPDGSITEIDKFVSSGSGSTIAYGLLEDSYEEELSKKEGIKLALKAINSALKRDTASGEGVDLSVIDEDGVKEEVSQKLKTELDIE